LQTGLPVRPVRKVRLRVRRMMTQGFLAKPAVRGLFIACSLLAVIISSVAVLPTFITTAAATLQGLGAPGTTSGSCADQLFSQQPPTK
jgi:hypothetical protein